MKRNIIGAFAITFITIAFILVVNDISKLDDQPTHTNARKIQHQKGLVALDKE